jgi:hypothetical protein
LPASSSRSGATTRPSHKLTLTSAGKRLAKKGGRVKTTMTVVVKVHGRAVTTRVPVTLSFKKPHRH